MYSKYTFFYYLHDYFLFIFQCTFIIIYHNRMLYIIGGASSNQSGQFNMPINTTFLEDIWSWRLDIVNETWRQDNTNNELFLSTGYEYRNNTPAIHYITPNSPLEKLVKWWTPDRLHRVKNSPLLSLPYISKDELEM